MIVTDREEWLNDSLIVLENKTIKRTTGSCIGGSSLQEPAVFCDWKRENLYVDISEKTDIIVLTNVVCNITWKRKRIKFNVRFTVAAPVSAILYKCIVTETDIPFQYDDGYVRLTSLMKIRLQKKYGSDRFTFKTLNDEYGIFAVRGPKGVPHSLSEALKEQVNE